MRYGGYDLQKASKSKSLRPQNSYRLRKKMQNTTSNLVGKFNLKISDSMKTLNAFERTNGCGSPLSFQGSLFEQSQKSIKNACAYNPKDLRTEFNLNAGMRDNYVFGTNLNNFSARNELNGKSTVKIINTFKAIEENECVVSAESAYNSLQKLKDERRTIFKELLELSSCDESLEYRLVKDYLESNSYSDIENDTQFKAYLARKNYTDILQYLEDTEPKSLASISSSVARAQSALSKTTLNNTKTLSHPKLLRLTKHVPEAYYRQFCQSKALQCRYFKPNDLNSNAKMKTLQCKRQTVANPLYSFSDSYKELRSNCQELFEESFRKENFKLPKTKRSKFKEHKYEKIVHEFVKAQGYTDVKCYVDDKFGQFISENLKAFVRKHNSSADLKKKKRKPNKVLT